MKLLKLLTIVMILVVAGCTDDLLDTETLTDDALKSGHNKPLTFESEFDIWLSGERTFNFDKDGNLISFDQIVLGTGKARHLGKTKLKVEETIYLNTPPPFVGIATVTFTAANGDQLIFNTKSWISFEGDPKKKIMIIESDESFIVNVKGTGRFINAKGGTLHKDGIFDDNNGIGSATYTVTVEFNKKLKKVHQ